MLYQFSLVIPDRRPDEARLLRAVIENLGIKSSQIAETLQKDKINISFFISNKTLASKLKKKLNKTFSEEVIVSCRKLLKPDWLTKWKEYFIPFNFTKKLRLLPFGRKDPLRTTRQRIYIDTSVAFGSGLHSTTQLAAQFIEERRNQFQTFLDVGTGSGILCVVASFSGAKKITGIDIDKDSIVTAIRNMKLNQIENARIKRADISKFSNKQKFEFVAANIITDDLIKAKEKLLSLVKPGFYIAVSGISVSNLPRFRKNFESNRLKLLKLKTKRGWAALLYRAGRRPAPTWK